MTASASGMHAVAYARAVEPMSPRFTSAITSSPAARAYAQTCSKARTPAHPCASKNADCGFTATACCATASTMPQQNASTLDAGGQLAGAHGVEPDDELALLALDGVGEPVCELRTATVAIGGSLLGVGGAQAAATAALRKRWRRRALRRPSRVSRS